MEENKLVTLKLIEFNDLERNNLRVILTLASRALKQKWHIVEDEKADFYLFSLTAAANVSRDDKLKNLPLNRCMFCTTAQGIQTKYSLIVDEKRLPSLSALVSLFNRMVTTLDASPKTKTEELIVPITEGIEKETVEELFFDPEQGLLGYLLTLEATQFMISLNHRSNYPALYIDSDKSFYYSENSLEQLEPYLIPETLTSRAISKTEMEEYINSSKLNSGSLKELIWYIAIKTSLGKVIKGHSHAAIVTLKNWPDLRLFKCLDYAKVATFMKHNAASVETIAEQTKQPLAEINDFYNACYLMGLIEQKNETQINKKDISPERLDLLSKINARLK